METQTEESQVTLPTEFSVNVPMKIPYQRIEDLIVGAVEGGCSYWATDLKPLKRTFTKKDTDFPLYKNMIAHGFSVKDIEDEDTEYTVTPDKYITALQLMATKQPRHFANFIEENDDAETADVFFQLLCIGDVIYG